MSAEAIGALYENAKEKGDLEARPNVWLAESIQDYLCWQHGALAIAEKSAGSGARRKNDNLRRLCKAMHAAFLEAAGSDQGFYKFFRAMITPLVREGLPKNKTQGDAETFRQRWREISRE